MTDSLAPETLKDRPAHTASEIVPPAVAPPPGNPRFRLIDGVRAIAAMSVVLFHTTRPGGWVGAYRLQLASGVPLFFLISGFLLYRPFVSGRLARRPPIRVRDFARRRLLRIVPAYWVALTVFAIYPGLRGGVFGDRAPIFYGFAQTYFSDSAFNGLPVAWTLSTEMTFYILLPLYALVLAALCAGRSDRGTLRVELTVLAVLSIGAFAFRRTVHGSHWNLAHTLPATFDWFAIGMALAVVSAVIVNRGSTARLVTLIEQHPTLCWVGAFAAVTLAAVYTKLTGQSDPISANPLYYLWALIALCILLPAVFEGQRPAAPQRFLSLRFVGWLGLISYGIYLWHFPLTGEISRFDRWLGLDPASRLGAIVLLVFMPTIAVALGAVSYYVVERPALRLKPDGNRQRARKSAHNP